MDKMPQTLREQVVNAILDAGYPGSAEDYCRDHHSKPFDELTLCEAEMIVRILGKKPGCLFEAKEINEETWSSLNKNGTK